MFYVGEMFGNFNQHDVLVFSLLLMKRLKITHT